LEHLTTTNNITKEGRENPDSVAKTSGDIIYLNIASNTE